LKCLASLAGVEDHEALHDIACELGSDVPFFLGDSPLALGRGRGELLTPIPALPEAHFVLALPPVHVSTAEAYAELPAAMSATPRSFDSISAQQWDGMVSLAENDFEDVVCKRHEEVRASLAALRATGALMAQLSGSGAASFGLFPDRSRAERAATHLTERFGWPFVTTWTRRHLPRPTKVADGG
jgi:4-diphosphocytidyl-2-C-methyl-D-erythritol kinase